MNWTYRVFHDKEGYCVRVVYYEQDGTLLSYQEAPAVPTGETPAELAQDIQWFKEAFELPILTKEELDAELAEQPPKPKKEKGKRKTLAQVMADLEVEPTHDTPTDTPVLEGAE